MVQVKFVFNVSSTTAGDLLTVLGNGNVGIGTTGPLSTLDVNGGVAIGSYAGNNAAGSGNLIVSGNVGIGTTNPQAPLHIYSAVLLIRPFLASFSNVEIPQPKLIFKVIMLDLHIPLKIWREMFLLVIGIWIIRAVLE